MTHIHDLTDLALAQFQHFLSLRELCYFYCSSKRLLRVGKGILDKLFKELYQTHLDNLDALWEKKNWINNVTLGHAYFKEYHRSFKADTRLHLGVFLQARPDHFIVRADKVWNRKLFGDPDK